jgi:hypothetical protein
MIQSLLTYPPYKKYKKIIPRTYNVVKDRMEGSELSRNDKYWKKVYEKIDKIYDIESKILMEDTLLYRSSTNPNPINFKSLHGEGPLIYFGLDFVISTWFSLETYDRIQQNNRIKNKLATKYYLHVYKLQEKLNYKYIYKDSGTPLELDEKNALKYPCVHPQMILHGNNAFNDSELGIELTFPRLDKYNLKEIVRPIKTFEINIKKLQTHTNKYIFEWDPIKALQPL